MLTYRDINELNRAVFLATEIKRPMNIDIMSSNMEILKEIENLGFKVKFNNYIDYVDNGGMNITIE